MKSENILIVRTDRIGDVILTLPLAEMIKRHLPESRVTFFVRDYTRPLLSGHKYIDDVIISEEMLKSRSFFAAVKALKRYDTVITVHPRFKLALIFFFAGIKTRVGTAYRWYSFLFNKRIKEHRKHGTNHELLHNVNLLQKIGIKESPTPAEIDYGISVNEKADKEAEEILEAKNFNKDKPTVVIHPGSGGSAVDLPKEKFKELIELLSENDINICVTGGESERELCSFVADDKALNLAGAFNLPQLTAFINRADVLAANSTGPLHIAAALGKYVVGFFPKVPSCSPTRWGPFTEKKAVFTPEIECSDCTTEQCERLNCMNSIEIAEVKETIFKFISNIRRGEYENQ